MSEIFSLDMAIVTAFASIATTSLFLAATVGLTQLFGRID